jgi:uncharacterized protein (DUF2235 family)
MGKKIVVFADGTGNTVDRHDSNVLRLCKMLELSGSSDQVAIYDPGVGTSATLDALRKAFAGARRLRLVEEPARRNRMVRIARLAFELGFGLGTARNIRQLYGALIEEYEPGADIYLFGFSRGAFTIRALAGLVYRCGIPKKADDGSIEAAIRLYRLHYEACRNDAQLRALKADVERFKRAHAHMCDIRFLGIWDTVKAVGYLWPKNLPHVRHNPIVQSVRHALSLSERRTFYVPTTWGGLDGDTRPAIRVSAHLAADDPNRPRPSIGWQDVKEIWFAGDHSDVGGGRAVGQRALADVSLHWMINEARQNGLRFRDDELRKLVEASRGAALSAEDVHNDRDRLPSALFWWLTELAPRRDIINEPPPPRRPFRVLWPAGRRKIAPSARSGVVWIHDSAKRCYPVDAPPWKGVSVRFVEM